MPTGHCAIPGLAVWSANVSTMPISSGENHRPFQVTSGLVRNWGLQASSKPPHPNKSQPALFPGGRDRLQLLEAGAFQR